MCILSPLRLPAHGLVQVLKEEFKTHFRNVTRIMDCVGCDKCRLWGKVQTTGIATALKILFELDEKALKYGDSPSIHPWYQAYFFFQPPHKLQFITPLRSGCSYKHAFQVQREPRCCWGLPTDVARTGCISHREDCHGDRNTNNSSSMYFPEKISLPPDSLSRWSTPRLQMRVPRELSSTQLVLTPWRYCGTAKTVSKKTSHTLWVLWGRYFILFSLPSVHPERKKGPVRFMAIFEGEHLKLYTKRLENKIYIIPHGRLIHNMNYINKMLSLFQVKPPTVSFESTNTYSPLGPLIEAHSLSAAGRDCLQYSEPLPLMTGGLLWSSLMERQTDGPRKILTMDLHFDIPRLPSPVRHPHSQTMIHLKLSIGKPSPNPRYGGRWTHDSGKLDYTLLPSTSSSPSSSWFQSSSGYAYDSWSNQCLHFALENTKRIPRRS